MAFIIFNGKKFNRDEKSGYYRAHFGKKVKSLHRYVWEYYNGEIHKGYHIHHIDENKDNNEISNLKLISAQEHLSMHSKENYKKNKEKIDKRLEDIRELTKDWHSSKEGLAWHSEHGKRVFRNLKDITLICEVCGKPYTTKSTMKNKSRFCSNACKSKFRRDSGIDDEIRICAYCGKEFTTNKYSKTKFCSGGCFGANKSKISKENRESTCI